MFWDMQYVKQPGKKKKTKPQKLEGGAEFYHYFCIM